MNRTGKERCTLYIEKIARSPLLKKEETREKRTIPKDAMDID